MTMETPQEEQDRFWTLVRKTPGCWLWTGTLFVQGYGRFYRRGGRALRRRSLGAHAYAYELIEGPVPDGKELHHVCANRACVNPAHLVAVTRWQHVHIENTARGPSARGLPTHCKHGHEYTPENTYIVPGRGHRQCRECVRRAGREYHHRKRAKVMA